MRSTVQVEHRSLSVAAETQRAVLMSDSGDRNFLANVDVAGEHSDVTATAMNVAFPLMVHQLLGFFLQAFVGLGIVFPIREDD